MGLARRSRFLLGLALLLAAVVGGFSLPAPQRAEAASAMQVAASIEHTCVRLQDTTAKCWGRNLEGELGDGTTTQRNTPVPVCATGTWNGSVCSGGSALSGVTWITAGESFTCAGMSGGGVKCWGWNAVGQLGDGTMSDRLNPVDVCATGSWNGSACSGSALSGITQVSAGTQHACGLTTGSGVKCWGWNGSGELGDGTFTGPRLNPVDVCASGSGAGCGGGSVLTGASLVTVGGSHTCAVLSGGAKCWGYNTWGQLGNGDEFGSNAFNPVDVINNKVRAVDTGGVGDHNSLALDTGGNPVVSYRDNVNGDLQLLHCGNRNCTAFNSITSPDTGGDVGRFTSLALDASGNPVVSYYDATNGDLKVLHCDDANCSPGGDSITSPDTSSDVGSATSLALDASGNPVVSYYDATNGDLKVLHCNDANCAAGGDSITSPDTGGIVGLYTSLALDGSGNPVVGYYDFTNGDLKVLHCNDANCAAGGDSITSPDTGGVVGPDPSLALDASGNPVISYRDGTNSDLKVLHCNDANCAGANESITSPDTGGSVGDYTSLVLDASGNPVVSYQDSGNGDLKLLHCNDANCAAGGDSIASPDTGGVDIVGQYTSLVLDASGSPVVSYYDFDNGNLKLLHCGDANCSALLGSVTWLDAGYQHSCAVVAAGEVRCWGKNSDGQLGDGNASAPNDVDTPVAVCDGAACAGNLTGATFVAAGGYHSCATFASTDTVKCWGSDTYGQLGDGGGLSDSDTPRNVCADSACTAAISNALPGGGDLGYYHSCGITVDRNIKCAGFNFFGTLGDGNAPNLSDTPVLVTGFSSKNGDGPVAVDTAGNVGQYTSMELDASGNPVVSYYDDTNDDLKVLHCGNPSCTSGNSIASPDTTGDVGRESSLELDASGNPVVSYHDATNGDLKVLHCGNATCTAGNSISTPDNGFVGFSGTKSLKLDASGNPVVAYRTTGALNVLQCGNATCTAGNTIATPDLVTPLYPSLALDASGNPVVSYSDSSESLKVLHCGNATCTAGNTIQTADATGDVGFWSSLELDAAGNPVIAHFDFSNFDLKVLRCGDATCATGNTTSTFATGTAIGWHASLTLDATERPVVASTDSTLKDLKVLVCGNPACTGANTIASPDTNGDVGYYPSIELDTSGNPVISYYDETNGDLKVLHCNDPSCSGTSAPPPVTTFLGDGIDGDCASGPATTCRIDGPRGMYAAGLVTYLADGDNCRVKKVEGGMVSTIAGLGPGSCNFNGNGTATSASLNHPNDVFLEGTDLYIADTDNCLVRKVDLSLGTPTISTVAGLAGTCTSVDGSTGVATFNKPAGVAFFNGAVYVAERDGCKIRKVQGGTVSTIAGTGTCGFDGDGGPAISALLDHPTDVAVMRPGFGLLIADRDNHRIRFIHLVSGGISTVVGSGSAVDGFFSGDGGPPTSARLNGPEAVDSADGQILIADTQNDRIRIANTFTNEMRTFMGEDGLLDVALALPRSVAVTGLGVVIAGEEAGGSAASSQPGDVKAGFVRACSFTNPQCYEATISGVDAYGDNTFTSVPTTSCSFVPGSAGSIDVGLPLLLLGAVALRKRIRTLFLQLRSALAPVSGAA